MELAGTSAIVTGGASGLGLATARRLAGQGVATVIVDLPSSDGAAQAGKLGEPRDVRACRRHRRHCGTGCGPYGRGSGAAAAVVHCAGRGGTVRVVERDGQPGSPEVLRGDPARQRDRNLERPAGSRRRRWPATSPRRANAGSSSSPPRSRPGRGRSGRSPTRHPRAASCRGPSLRPAILASRLIRVCTIAPGVFDTPILGPLLRRDQRPSGRGRYRTHPGWGIPDEFAMLALQILANPMLNGETIRLDGAIRMAPR